MNPFVDCDQFQPINCWEILAWNPAKNKNNESPGQTREVVPELLHF